jgi:hypothetical protein
MHLLVQFNDTVLYHKTSMLNFCADDSEIDSYSSKILTFTIVYIVSRFSNNKNITIIACLTLKTLLNRT